MLSNSESSPEDIESGLSSPFLSLADRKPDSEDSERVSEPLRPFLPYLNLGFRVETKLPVLFGDWNVTAFLRFGEFAEEMWESRPRREPIHEGVGAGRGGGEGEGGGGGGLASYPDL